MESFRRQVEAKAFVIFGTAISVLKSIRKCSYPSIKSICNFFSMSFTRYQVNGRITSYVFIEDCEKVVV